MGDLVVDFDRTLVKANSLIEAIWQLLITEPAKLFRILFTQRVWVNAKAKIFVSANVVGNHLQIRPEVEDLIRIHLQKGSRVVVASGSPSIVIRRVLERIDLQKVEVLASDSVLLKGRRKLEALETLGVREFTYVGDSLHDIPLWRKSRTALDVSRTVPYIVHRVFSATTLQKLKINRRGSLKTFLEVVRVKQWAKNLLIFIPPVLALTDGTSSLENLHIWSGVAAFFAFNSVASIVYITNDLVDLSVDRNHPTKFSRPIASGSLPVATALTLPIFLGSLAFVFTSLSQSSSLAGVLVVYLLAASSYSLHLKKIAIVDVVILSGLHMLRLFVGSQVFGVVLTFWFVVFAFLFFVSMACLKRYVEWSKLEGSREASSGVRHRRGYTDLDTGYLWSSGLAFFIASSVVLASYLQVKFQLETLANSDYIAILVLPIWVVLVGRVWLAASRGVAPAEPLFAFLRPVSLALALAGLIALFVAGAQS